VRRLPCSLAVLSLKRIGILQAFATSRPSIFDALKIFTCLATQMRIIPIRVSFGVWLLRMVDLFFKILNLSITLIKLSFIIL